MSVDDAYRWVQYVANKSQNGNITPADFNLLAPIAQMSVLNDRLGNVKKYRPRDPVPPYGVMTSQKINEELKSLFQKSDLTITSGSITAPADVVYVDTAIVTSLSTGYVIKEVYADELVILNQQVIKPPSSTHPVFFRRTKTAWDIYPTFVDTTPVYLFYYRTPVAPKWNYTLVSGAPVYNPTGSQDFELSATTHFEICTRILSAIGINLDNDDITQWAELQEQKGS